MVTGVPSEGALMTAPVATSKRRQNGTRPLFRRAELSDKGVHGVIERIGADHRCGRGGEAVCG